jgi:predicted ATPase
LNNIKIAIIGGPSSGKTSLINKLKNRGYTCKSEVSREIIKKAKVKGVDQIFLDNPIWFSEKLLTQRIKQFEEAEKNIDQYVFFDRGIPDIVAYLDYIKCNYSNIFIEESQKYRYDKVFILPPWKEIYIQDNERYETFGQAVEINKFLTKWYTKFGYEIKSIPKLSIENRIDFILKNI